MPRGHARPNQPRDPASLAHAFRTASARITPAPTPLASLLIHGAAIAAWLVATALAIQSATVFTWTAGLVYVGYDTLLLALVGWQLRALRPAPPHPRARIRRPTLCVVIAAYNEAAALPRTLEALLAQSDPADEVVIADDGSSDGTSRLLVERFGFGAPGATATGAPGTPHATLRWLRVPHGGKARALNAAVLSTTADIVVTVDADTLVEHGAIAAIRDAFAGESGLVAATGVLRPTCANTWLGRAFEQFQTYEYIRNFLSRQAWTKLDSLLLISGAFGAYRRNALLAVGGFDPDCLVEDYELVHRLRRYAVRENLAWTFRVLGQARASTDAPATVGAFMRQRRRWFGGFLQTQYWYREMVGARSHGRCGLLMLPVKAVDTVQPLLGLTALAVLVGALAHRRLDIVGPIAIVMLCKIGVDLAFHLWSVRLYRRWVHDRTTASAPAAMLAAVVEPFTFQLLRHASAAWGWFSVLTGRWSWGHARSKAARTRVAPSTEGG
jgi:glycosyltransferase involved in cell wall biosynthesis